MRLCDSMAWLISLQRSSAVKEKREAAMHVKNLTLLYVYLFSFFMSGFLYCLLLLFVALYLSFRMIVGILVYSCFCFFCFPHRPDLPQQYTHTQTCTLLALAV